MRTRGRRVRVWADTSEGAARSALLAAVCACAPYINSSVPGTSSNSIATPTAIPAAVILTPIAVAPINRCLQRTVSDCRARVNRKAAQIAKNDAVTVKHGLNKRHVDVRQGPLTG